jgi:hypothetical protein
MLCPLLDGTHVVVMDNAVFHKSNKTRELIHGKGAALLFLPPYSPDLNPVVSWDHRRGWTGGVGSSEGLETATNCSEGDLHGTPRLGHSSVRQFCMPTLSSPW